MVVFCDKRGVAITVPVHHGAAGDNDGSKQCADAVLKGRKLLIKTNKGRTIDEQGEKKIILTTTGSKRVIFLLHTP